MLLLESPDATAPKAVKWLLLPAVFVAAARSLQEQLQQQQQAAQGEPTEQLWRVC